MYFISLKCYSLFMLAFTLPSSETLEAFLAGQAALKLTYEPIGIVDSGAPAGFVSDGMRVKLGRGEAVFSAACEAVRSWKMFPAAWMRIAPADAPIEVGRNVAVLSRVLGVWWFNACRIVSTIDERHATPIRRFGFVYGTLPAHLERGEERFLIEWDADENVWYDLRAISRPRSWIARLGYPFTRLVQSQFRKASAQSMLAAVKSP